MKRSSAVLCQYRVFISLLQFGMLSFSCKTSVEGYLEVKCSVDDEDKKPTGYSWLIEECILASYDRKCVTCPTHGEILLAQVAPDTVSVNEDRLPLKIQYLFC